MVGATHTGCFQVCSTSCFNSSRNPCTSFGCWFKSSVNKALYSVFDRLCLLQLHPVRLTGFACHELSECRQLPLCMPLHSFLTAFACPSVAPLLAICSACVAVCGGCCLHLAQIVVFLNFLRENVALCADRSANCLFSSAILEESINCCWFVDCNDQLHTCCGCCCYLCAWSCYALFCVFLLYF
jgi:hypothetical protein